MYLIIVSKSGSMDSILSSKSRAAIPCFADAKTKGHSKISSSAPSSINKSRTSSTTSRGLASGLSTLFMQTITGRFSSKDFFKTNFVWGIGPSKASTSNTTPFTILSTRSTSPPKSACPGVSMMLILTPLWFTAVFLERIVIPLSLSMSLESITLSLTCWLSLKIPDCLSSASTSVVLPWSTWAIIAIFLISSLFKISSHFFKLLSYFKLK